MEERKIVEIHNPHRRTGDVVGRGLVILNEIEGTLLETLVKNKEGLFWIDPEAIHTKRRNIKLSFVGFLRGAI